MYLITRFWPTPKNWFLFILPPQLSPLGVNRYCFKFCIHPITRFPLCFFYQAISVPILIAPLIMALSTDLITSPVHVSTVIIRNTHYSSCSHDNSAPRSGAWLGTPTLSPFFRWGWPRLNPRPLQLVSQTKIHTGFLTKHCWPRPYWWLT